MSSLEDEEENGKPDDINYKQELMNQIERTKGIITMLEKSSKQFSTVWYMAAYMTIILSIMLIKMIWW